MSGLGAISIPIEWAPGEYTVMLESDVIAEAFDLDERDTDKVWQHFTGLVTLLTMPAAGRCSIKFEKMRNPSRASWLFYAFVTATQKRITNALVSSQTDVVRNR